MAKLIEKDQQSKLMDYQTMDYLYHIENRHLLPPPDDGELVNGEINYWPNTDNDYGVINHLCSNQNIHHLPPPDEVWDKYEKGEFDNPKNLK